MVWVPCRYTQQELWNGVERVVSGKGNEILVISPLAEPQATRRNDHAPRVTMFRLSWRSAGVFSCRGSRRSSVFRRSESSEIGLAVGRLSRGPVRTFPCGLRAARLSSSVPSPNKEYTEPAAATAAPETKKKKQFEGHLDSCARGLGQVIFLNSAQGGGLVLISLALGDPLLAAFAACGSFVSTTTARLFGCDDATIRSGLYGYNGALIGCATSVFGPSYVPFNALATCVGACATAPLAHALGKSLSRPQFTWVFNAVTLTSLLRTRPLLGTGSPAEQSAVDIIATTPVVLESSFAGVSQILSTASVVLESSFAGVSQIFLVDSPVCKLHA